MLESATIDTFSPHVNSVFKMQVGADAWIDATLTSAVAGNVPANAAIRPPFSLYFTTSEQIVRPQQIYTLRHPQLGEMAIFLVPVRKTNAGVEYEAVFG